MQLCLCARIGHKNPPQIGEGIDKTAESGYTKHRKGATDRRFPFLSYREVTVCREAWRLLLFIFYLDDQGDQCDNEQTELQ